MKRLIVPNQVNVQGTTITMNLNEGIDPNNTDFTTTPPTVAMINRNDYNGGVWGRGAYVYSVASGVPPVVTKGYEGVDVSCPSSPVNVSFGVGTDIAAYCRWHLSNVTYPNMANQYSGGEGTIHHWNPQDLACGQVATIWVSCGTAAMGWGITATRYLTAGQF